MVVSRAEAQVMRLACLYALLDISAFIKVQHLRAALAVWRYCEFSAKYIFGERLGDPVADQLLIALKSCDTGLTRTQIRDYFDRNRRGVEIDRALRLLQEQRLASFQSIQTNGRPIEKWFAIDSG